MVDFHCGSRGYPEVARGALQLMGPALKEHGTLGVRVGNKVLVAMELDRVDSKGLKEIFNLLESWHSSSEGP